MQPKPTRDFILIERMKVSEKTASGIIIPGRAEHQVEVAKVLAVGQEVTGIVSGEQVVFKDFAVLEVEIESEKFTFVKEEDVIATI